MRCAPAWVLARKDHVDPVYLGVSYYLAVLNVPAMVVVHVLIFAYLLRRPAAK